ncbi:hypothetical protein ACOMHN_055543 [Nucella lapillus]
MFQNEILPDIPYRLNPRPESSSGSSSAVADTKPIPTITVVDMATSPLFPYDEDLNLGPSGTASPDSSCVFGQATFLTDRDLNLNVIKDLADELDSIDVNTQPAASPAGGEVTSRKTPNVTEEMTSPKVTTKPAGMDLLPDLTNSTKCVIKGKPKPTPVEPISRSVSFCQRLQRSVFPLKQFKDFTRLNAAARSTTTTPTSLMKMRGPPHTLLADPLLPPSSHPLPSPLPDTARDDGQGSPRKQRTLVLQFRT